MRSNVKMLDLFRSIVDLHHTLFPEFFFLLFFFGYFKVLIWKASDLLDYLKSNLYLNSFKFKYNK